MQPGQTRYYRCPYCSNVFANSSLLSGNTLGSKLYSDLKFYAPMLPQTAELSRCVSCRNFIWDYELIFLDEADWADNTNPFYESAQGFSHLSLKNLFDAVDKQFWKNTNQEILIRKLLWWGFNDLVRDGFNPFRILERNSDYRANVEILIPLLSLEKNHDNADWLILSELNRNIGNFNEASEHLERVQGRCRELDIKYQMLERIEIGNRAAFRLKIL